MSRLERLKSYQRMEGPEGNSRDSLPYWEKCAEKNSKIAPRAKDGEIDLPSTRVRMRDSSMRPYESRRDRDARAEALRDLNDVGSMYMRGVRRSAD